MIPEILFMSFLFNGAFAQTADAAALTNATNAFSMSKIVPDVIQSFDPTALITMTFTDSVTKGTVDVNPGTVLSMEQSADEPEFFLNPAGSDASQQFVIVIVDPDAPTPQQPNISQFLHFVAGDFTADSSTGLLSNSSPALIEFYSPTPPTGSDIHRYVVLVFDQPDNFISVGSKFVNDSTPRQNFSETVFAQQTNLGPPVAGSYFLVGPWGASLTPTAPSGAIPTSPSAGFSIKMHRPGNLATAGLAMLCGLMVYLL